MHPRHSISLRFGSCVAILERRTPTAPPAPPSQPRDSSSSWSAITRIDAILGPKPASPTASMYASPIIGVMRAYSNSRRLATAARDELVERSESRKGMT